MSNKGQASAGVGIAVAAVIIVALTSIGYYQYVFVPSFPTTATTSSTPTGPQAQINITIGAAAKTDDAFSPNPVTVVIGVNNTFVVYNGDIQNGVGVPHSYTDKNNVFTSGILQGGDTSPQITVSTPGTYNVYCVIHPTTMRGVLKVIQGTGAGKSSSTTSTGTSTSSASSTTSTKGGTGSTTSGSGSSAGGQGLTVIIPNGTGADPNSAGFIPSTITVVIGVNSTVNWKNMDVSSHTVTAVDGSFDSGMLSPGQSFSHTFTTPGTYQVKCNYHNWMHETVVVKAKS